MTKPEEDGNDGGILQLVDKLSEKESADRALTFILRRLAMHADSSGAALQRIAEQNTKMIDKLDEFSGVMMQFAGNAERSQASLLRLQEEHNKVAHRVERIRARVKTLSDEETTERHGSQNLIAVATPMQAIPVGFQTLPSVQTAPQSKAPRGMSKSDLPKAIDDEVNRRVGRFILATVAAVGGAIAGGIGTAILANVLSHWH